MAQWLLCRHEDLNFNPQHRCQMWLCLYNPSKHEWGDRRRVNTFTLSQLSSLNNYFLFYVYGYYSCMCICSPYIHSACSRQKRTLDLLVLALQMLVTAKMVLGKQSPGPPDCQLLLLATGPSLLLPNCFSWFIPSAPLALHLPHLS